MAATCSSWSTQVMLVGTSTESIRRSPESLAAGIWLTQTKQRRRGARSCSLGLALVLLQYTHCPSVEETGFPPCCIRARGSSPHQAFTRWARAKQQAGKGSLWQQVEQNVGTSPSQALSPQHTARPEHTAAHLEHQPCILPPYGVAVHRNVAPSIPSPRVLSPRSRTCPEQHFWSPGSVLLHPNGSTQHPECSGRGRTSPHLHSSASTLLEAALHPPRTPQSPAGRFICDGTEPRQS